MNGTAWLAALAVVTAVNPARVAEVVTGLRRSPASGPGALPTAMAGTAGTAAVFLMLAAIASGLLGAVDVSPATLLVGAGLILIIGAARDLLVGAPPAEPALRGWAAAVVPVAIPSVARPQVGLLALAAGGHYGMVPVLVGSVALVLSVGALAGWAGGGDPRRMRILRWGAAVSAVVTAGVGAALAVEGVFAV